MQSRTVEKAPNEPSFAILKAHNCVSTGFLKHAVGLYHHALRLKPGIALVHLSLAVTYLLSVYQKTSGGDRHRPVLLAFAEFGTYRNARLGINSTEPADVDTLALEDEPAAAAGGSKKRARADVRSDSDEDYVDEEGDNVEGEAKRCVCACVCVCVSVCVCACVHDMLLCVVCAAGPRTLMMAAAPVTLKVARVRMMRYLFVLAVPLDQVVLICVSLLRVYLVGLMQFGATTILGTLVAGLHMPFGGLTVTPVMVPVLTDIHGVLSS